MDALGSVESRGEGGVGDVGVGWGKQAVATGSYEGRIQVWLVER